jgi:polyisoprenoid-binding protein YceI
MKKMIFIVFACMGLIAFANTHADQEMEWGLDNSSVKFDIKNAGITVNGSFGDVTAKILFDKTKSYGNSIEASIEANTIKTGINARDEHLKKEEYFNVVKYPKIIMKSTAFTKENDGNFTGYFKLTIKNKSKDIAIPFTIGGNNAVMTLKGKVKINRLDFGVGKSGFLMSDEVLVYIEVKASKK